MLKFHRIHIGLNRENHKAIKHDIFNPDYEFKTLGEICSPFKISQYFEQGKEVFFYPDPCDTSK